MLKNAVLLALGSRPAIVLADSRCGHHYLTIVWVTPMGILQVADWQHVVLQD